MERKEFLLLAIATLITVISWMGFDLAFHRQKTEVSPQIQQLTEPIDPNFDLSAFQ
jgi:hypothetical protein